MTTNEWLAQEARFKALSGHTCGIWQRDEGAADVTWNVTPMAGSSMDQLRALRAEAVLAGKLLVRAGLLPEPRADAEDDWLNALRLLTPSEAGYILSGSTDGRRHEGRSMDDLEARSAVACAMLAGGARLD